MVLQHEHEDGANWSDTEAIEDLAIQSTSNSADEAVLQSQEELRDGLTDITDVRQAWATIQHCSVIVGMHPDQVGVCAVRSCTLMSEGNMASRLLHVGILHWYVVHTFQYDPLYCSFS